jgi:N-methylhydantoinase A
MNKLDLARSIIAVANHNMANAIKLISVNRGYDPRDFTLVAFGGGGGMHAAYLLKDLGIKKFIVPKFSGVFSSWGMLMSDLRRDFFQNIVIPFETDNSFLRINENLKEIEAHSTEIFKKDGLDCSTIKFKRFANIRYENQGHSVEIQLPE